MRISHADVDFLGEIKVSALLGLLEQTAVEASAASGFDPARYTELGRVWLVRRTRLERLTPVGGGDVLRVSTHVADFRRARSLRRYTVRRTEGLEPRPEADAVRATTDWVYCDVDSGHPVSVPDEMKLALFGTTEAPSEGRAARVETPDEPPAASFPLQVRPSHLDHMLHVNNATWADFLEDAALALLENRGLTLDTMLDRGGALRIASLDLEYLGDARQGQTLAIRTWIESGQDDLGRGPTLVHEALAPDNRRLLRARGRWAWRQRPDVLGGVPVR